MAVKWHVNGEGKPGKCSAGAGKCPGRDRTKNAPTKKRKNRCRTAREVILPVCPARAQTRSLEATVLADGGTHGVAGTSQAAIKWGNVACTCRLHHAI